MTHRDATNPRGFGTDRRRAAEPPRTGRPRLGPRQVGRREADPASVGIDPAGLQQAVDLASSRDAATQLLVVRHGTVVLNRCFRCGPTSLFWIFSASKPYTAVLVHLLAQQGRIRLDAPVCRYWPRFARHGKDDITVRHVLQHRSGLADAGHFLGDLLAMTSWQRTIRRIERARPRWPAGAVPAYQPLIFGFILGELVQRVTGAPVQDALRAELLEPLRATDTYLGLPNDQWLRRVPMHASGPLQRCARTLVDRRGVRGAVVPAAGICTTAYDLATFYLMLLGEGTIHGARIMEASTIRTALTPSSDGELDRRQRTSIRWSQGFQLGGPRPEPTAVNPLGRLSSPRAFGHVGSNCCTAWADPDRQLVVAYLTNRVSAREAGLRHLADVADAVVRSCVD